MRVIGGEFRSRVLKSIAGLNTRPTPDRLRETLFDVLTPRIAGAKFADLYAGTGAVGIEALSRGASRAIFVENNRTALQTIRENLRALDLNARADVRQGNPPNVVALMDADIVFLDPPYALEKEYVATMTALGEKPAAMVIVQHSTRLALQETYGALRRTRVLKQGDNALSFYAPAP